MLTDSNAERSLYILRPVLNLTIAALCVAPFADLKEPIEPDAIYSVLCAMLSSAMMSADATRRRP